MNTLDALEVPAVNGDQMRDIPVDKITPSPWQRRRLFDPEKLKELAESIRANTLVQPIVVRILDEPDAFELIAGERRWRAHKLLQAETVRAIVKNISADEARVMVLVENIQREDMTLTETARNLKDLLETFGGNVAALVEKTGKSRTYIDDRLIIVEQPREIQNMIDEEKINLAQLKVIAQVPEESVRIEFAKKAAKLTLTAIELKGQLQRVLGSKTNGNGSRPSAGEGAMKFNTVSKSIINAFDAFEKFDFTMLRDPKKREQLLKQVGILEKSLARAKGILAAPPAPDGENGSPVPQPASGD